MSLSPASDSADSRSSSATPLYFNQPISPLTDALFAIRSSVTLLYPPEPPTQYSTLSLSWQQLLLVQPQQPTMQSTFNCNKMKTKKDEKNIEIEIGIERWVFQRKLTTMHMPKIVVNLEASAVAHSEPSYFITFFLSQRLSIELKTVIPNQNQMFSAASPPQRQPHVFKHDMHPEIAIISSLEFL